jgi:hypothetical protein
MNVTFHAVASFGIGHVAARNLAPDSSEAFDPRDTRVLITAFVAGVLSHGVLDGLKHGYPIHGGFGLGSRFRARGAGASAQSALWRPRAGCSRRCTERELRPPRLQRQQHDTHLV